MGVIFMILLQIWLWKKCVSIPHSIMGYHTGNVHYAVLMNALESVYLVRRQINIQQKICSTIHSHLYRISSFFTVHGIYPYVEWTIYLMCSTDISSVKTIKVYTQKELVLLEPSISEFYENNALQKFKNWHFIFHMCVLLEHNTVAKNGMSHLDIIANNIIFYARVIM